MVLHTTCTPTRLVVEKKKKVKATLLDWTNSKEQEVRSFKIWKMVSLAMLAFSPLAALAQADIRAEKCFACSEVQFEQKAIMAGMGNRYVYDFGGGTLRQYYVSREPGANGGYYYEVIEIGAEPVYEAVWQKAKSVYQTGGTLARSVVLPLPTAAGAGSHGGDSVYSLFSSNSGTGGFGFWLTNYFTTQGIPVTAPQGADDLDRMIKSNPTIIFKGDAARLTVTVQFKDGRAEFKLSEGEDLYKYVSGSAFDADGHQVPESLSQVSLSRYEFPGGPTSSTYKGFQDLMQFWGIVPVTEGKGWACTVSPAGTHCTYYK